jgi:hypothetical protein
MKSLVVPCAVSLFLLDFYVVDAFCGFQCQGVPRLHNMDTVFRNKQTFITITKQSTESGDQLDEEEMAARMMELEAMGGDPFFMTGGDDDDAPDIAEFMAKVAMAGSDDTQNVVEKRFATDGLGPSPKFKEPLVVDEPGWEWDGTVDENAHLD